MQPPCLEILSDFRLPALQFPSLAILDAPGHLVHPSACAHPVFPPYTLTRSSRGWHKGCVLEHRTWSQKLLGLHGVALPGSKPHVFPVHWGSGPTAHMHSHRPWGEEDTHLLPCCAPPHPCLSPEQATYLLPHRTQQALH